jgi:hypothetical protein
MTARKRRISVTVEYARHTAFFVGLARDLVPAVQAAGVPYQWNHARRALAVPKQDAGEVEARLVAAGFDVQAVLVPG